MNTQPRHTKADIITWLERNIPRREGGLVAVERPCLEGMKAALYYLQQSDAPAASTAQVTSVSHGEMDAVIKELEAHYSTTSRDPAYALCKLLNYVKTSALMPKEPSDVAINKLFAGFKSEYYPQDIGEVTPSNMQKSAMKKAYNALYTHLTTPPKKKMKKVWCVAFTANNRDGIYATGSRAATEAYRESASTMKAYTNLSPIWEQEVEDV